MGPCQELFGGVYNNIDVFFNMAACLGLGRSTNATGQYSNTTYSPVAGAITNKAAVSEVPTVMKALAVLALGFAMLL